LKLIWTTISEVKANCLGSTARPHFKKKIGIKISIYSQLQYEMNQMSRFTTNSVQQVMNFCSWKQISTLKNQVKPT
jgi:predicted phosphoadenosine phosphosulfate sulfurtransferase